MRAHAGYLCAIYSVNSRCWRAADAKHYDNTFIGALYACRIKNNERAVQIYREFVPNQYLAVVAADPDTLITQLTQIRPQLDTWVAQGLIKITRISACGA